ncbi:alpha/beta hydrolase [Subtercola sp. YIM 133946]|uniref:alpha/beta hydrolase n=1 Tax=Subtercola sp. YIM 133946 TaxID=3118909 RepID=UPI002F938ECD
MTELLDIEFAPGLLLDIVLPDDTLMPLPVIVWLHGGAWRMGDRRLAPDLHRYFADSGFAMVSIDYRLSGEAVFPAQLFDVRTAIRWVREHADDYGFDGDAIGLWGSSAGGHLGALAGVLGGVATLPGETPSGTSAAVQAVVDGYGAGDLLAPDQSVPPTEGLLGGPVAEHEELAVAASPARQARDDAPPFLIMHGAADPLVPASQSVALFEALAAQGVPATLYVIEGFGHGFFNPAGSNELAGPPIDAGRLEAEPNASAEVLRHPPAEGEAFVPASFDLIETFLRAQLGHSRPVQAHIAIPANTITTEN